MLLIFVIIAIIIACILSFLIVRVWSNPKVNDPTQNSSSHLEFGAIGPPEPNNGSTSGNQHAPGSHNSGNPLKPQPGGNSEG
jgi:hypothetical protein